MEVLPWMEQLINVEAEDFHAEELYKNSTNVKDDGNWIIMGFADEGTVVERKFNF